MAASILSSIQQGDFKSLARAITIVENELNDYNTLLEQLSFDRQIPVIGITGPPGAGKSSLVNALIKELIKQGKQIGVIAIDPTSPFNFGSLLGDRIRMAEYFTHPDVFIRSMATRGSLGGLTEKIMEVTDVMRAAPFDFIFVETVGVGQSEVEIAGLADTTVVVFVPDAGDEIQTMKAGLMEIADIFVVNKSDHQDADRLVANLVSLISSGMNKDWQIPVLKTVATKQEGINELIQKVELHGDSSAVNSRKPFLLTEKAWQLMVKERMKDVSREGLMSEISEAMKEKSFNVYRFVKGGK